MSLLGGAGGLILADLLARSLSEILTALSRHFTLQEWIMQVHEHIPAHEEVSPMKLPKAANRLVMAMTIRYPHARDVEFLTRPFTRPLAGAAD